MLLTLMCAGQEEPFLTLFPFSDVATAVGLPLSPRKTARYTPLLSCFGVSTCFSRPALAGTWNARFVVYDVVRESPPAGWDDPVPDDANSFDACQHNTNHDNTRHSEHLHATDKRKPHRRPRGTRTSAVRRQLQLPHGSCDASVPRSCRRTADANAS